MPTRQARRLTRSSLPNFPLEVGGSHHVLVTGGIGTTTLVVAGVELHRRGVGSSNGPVGRSQAEMAHPDEHRRAWRSGVGADRRRGRRRTCVPTFATGATYRVPASQISSHIVTVKLTLTSEGNSMKISVDRDRCEGYGMCAQAAPNLIELDDEGDPQAGDLELEYTVLDDAQRAARACPMAAIQLTGTRTYNEMSSSISHDH